MACCLQAAAWAMLKVREPMVSYPIVGHPMVSHQIQCWEHHTVARMVMMDVNHSYNHVCEVAVTAL